MNKFRNIILSALLLVAVGCTQEVVYDTPVEVGWTGYVSNIGNDLREDTKVLNVGDFVLIRDASLGALSHEWIIEEPECASFFTTVDDTSSTLEESVITTNDAYVVFKDRGIVTITLRNTFPEEVVANSVNEEKAVYDEENDVWVFEKTFEFDVYGDLRPDIIVERVTPDGEAELLYSSETDGWEDIRQISINQIEDKLRLTYPNESKNADHSSTQTWLVPTEGRLEGQNSGQTVVATFAEATTGEAISGFQLTVNRVENTTLKIPFRTITMDVPIELTVDLIPVSPAAPDADVWLVANSEYLQIPFNKELQEIADDSTLKNDFVISNPTRSGDATIAIAEVKVSEDDKKVLLVKPEGFAGVYSSASLVYTPTSGNDMLYAVEDTQKTTPAVEFSLALKFAKFAPAEADLRQQNNGWIMVPFSSAIQAQGLQDAKDAFTLSVAGEQVAMEEMKISESDATQLMLLPAQFDAQGASEAVLNFEPQDDTDRIYDAGGVFYFSESYNKSVELYQFAPISNQTFTQQSDGWFSVEFTSDVKDMDYQAAKDAFKMSVTAIDESEAAEYGIADIKVVDGKLWLLPELFSAWRVSKVELLFTPADQSDRIYDAGGAVFFATDYANANIVMYYILPLDLYSFTNTAGWWWPGMGSANRTAPYCNIESKDGDDNKSLYFKQAAKASAKDLSFFGPVSTTEIERGVAYTFKCRIFLVTEGMTGNNDIALYLSKSDVNNANYYYLPNKIVLLDPSITAGEWCDYTFDFTIPTGKVGTSGATALAEGDRLYTNKFKLLSTNWLMSLGQIAAEFYVDDIHIEKKVN